MEIMKEFFKEKKIYSLKIEFSIKENNSFISSYRFIDSWNTTKKREKNLKKQIIKYINTLNLNNLSNEFEQRIWIYRYYNKNEFDSDDINDMYKILKYVENINPINMLIILRTY